MCQHSLHFNVVENVSKPRWNFSAFVGTSKTGGDKKRDNVRQGKIASLLPPTHMERRRERKGMTGIRCWVDGHSDGISDDRVVRYFAFASVFEILVCFSFVLQASETG